MADNVVTNPGSGGATFATDDIGGVQWPFSKLAFGPRDTATEVRDVDGARLPVAADQDLLSTAVLLLGMILEKLPRVDANDRVMVNGSELAAATAAVTVSSGTVTTVTTASDVTRINSLGAAATSKPADAMPLHLANVGAQYLYNQIVVS